MEYRQHDFKSWITAGFVLCGFLSLCFNHLIVPSNHLHLITSSNYMEDTTMYAINQNAASYSDILPSGDQHQQTFTSSSCALFFGNSPAPERSKTKKIRLKNGKPFALKVYQEKDEPSESLRRGRLTSDKVEAFNNYVMDYSEKHRIPLSDLTFVDIGANISWFTMNLAALGVYVIAFGSQSSKKSTDIIKESMCLSENLDSGGGNHVTFYDDLNGFDIGEDGTDRCVIYTNNANAGDSHIQCTKDGNQEPDIPTNHSIKGHIPYHRLKDVSKSQGKIMVVDKMDTGNENSEQQDETIFFLEKGVHVIVRELVLDEPERHKKIFPEAHLVKTESRVSTNSLSHADMTSSSRALRQRSLLHQEPPSLQPFTTIDSGETKHQKRVPIYRVLERATKAQMVTKRERRRRMIE
jgi:hypothetical protein